MREKEKKNVCEKKTMARRRRQSQKLQLACWVKSGRGVKIYESKKEVRLAVMVSTLTQVCWGLLWLCERPFFKEGVALG